MTESAILHVAILINSSLQPAWLCALLTELAQSPSVRLSQMRTQPTPAQSPSPGILRRLDRLLAGPNLNPFATVDAKAQLEAIPALPAPEEVDVALQLDRHSPDRLWPQKARWGLWRFADDLDLPQAGFYQTLAGETTADLQLLCHLADHRILQLYRSPSATHGLSPNRTQARLYWKAAAFVPRLLHQLHTLGPQRFFALKTQCTSFPARRPTASLNLLARHIGRNLQRGLEHMYYRNQWTLQCGRGDLGPAVLSDCKVFRPPADRLWADPIAWFKNGTYYLFFEQMNFAAHKGHIALLEIDQHLNLKAEGPCTVLERPYHLSYPFLFHFENQLYMLPETHSNRSIEIYRCDQFPHRWSLCRVLMENIRAADATLHFHQGLWWLFAGLVDRPGISNRDELFLFYSDSPLSDKWTPHPLNPIVSNVHCARPAGPLFEQQGRLYRPAQNGSRRYGYGIKIQQVTELTPATYAEQERRSIEPWHPEVLATHTLSRAGELWFMDAKRRRPRLAVTNAT